MFHKQEHLVHWLSYSLSTWHLGETSVDLSKTTPKGESSHGRTSPLLSKQQFSLCLVGGMKIVKEPPRPPISTRTAPVILA